MPLSFFFFENSASSPWIFCELWIRRRVFSENFLNIFKAEPVSLPWQPWWSPGWARHFRDGTSKLDLQALAIARSSEEFFEGSSDRRRDRFESTHGPREKKHSEVRTGVIERSILSTLHSFKKQRVLGVRFGDPMSLPFCTSLFSCTLMHSCRSVRLQSGDLSAPIWFTGQAALDRFSSGDAIIIVGSVLEKHFDDDFTPDQEKDITSKRWPPRYQTWKLSLALNGLSMTVCRGPSSDKATDISKGKSSLFRRAFSHSPGALNRLRLSVLYKGNAPLLRQKISDRQFRQ